MRHYTIASIPADGIGPEVIAAGLEALDVGLRVLVGRDREIEPGGLCVRFLHERVEREPDAEATTDGLEERDRRARVRAADVVGDLRVVADGSDAVAVGDGLERGERGGRDAA